MVLLSRLKWKIALHTVVNTSALSRSSASHCLIPPPPYLSLSGWDLAESAFQPKYHGSGFSSAKSWKGRQAVAECWEGFVFSLADYSIEVRNFSSLLSRWPLGWLTVVRGLLGYFCQTTHFNPDICNLFPQIQYCKRHVHSENHTLIYNVHKETFFPFWLTKE